MLKIRDDVDLKELEKFGFKKNERGNYNLIRKIEDVTLYRIFITNTHHYVQIRIFDECTIAKSLQETLFDLIQAGLVEKVEVN